MMKIKLKRKGVSIIVNTLPDPTLVEKTLALIAFAGKCYQISQSPSKTDKKIGNNLVSAIDVWMFRCMNTFLF